MTPGYIPPNQLTPQSFGKYPPEARKVATQHIELLRKLPLAFLPLLLREMMAYDWKFPAERREIDEQMRYLGAMDEAHLRVEMSGFSSIRLTPELERMEWVSEPAQFSEKLTAYLWSTHQMDGFRKASIEYIHALHAAMPVETLPVARLTLVQFGVGVKGNRYPLFRKLKPHGVYFTNVKPDEGEILLSMATARAKAYPRSFGHWYIDGAEEIETDPAVTSVAYSSLRGVRDELVNKMRLVMQPGGGGPEVLRTMLAQVTPGELGLKDEGAAAVLNRFQVSLLTEGSGTQLFSTTFVQWSAREALRRAQPVTLFLRYAPRQKEQSMKELLAGTQHAPVPDFAGSLIDADMGAYYTWINQQRLAGAEKAGFVAWFEGQREAFASGPGLVRGSVNGEVIGLGEIVKRLTG